MKGYSMKIKSTIEITCSPEEIFSWIDNPDKALRWQKNVKSGEIIVETPERIGTTFREEIEEDGKKLIIFGEITGYIPNKSISFHLKSKIHKVIVKYSLGGDAKLTKVTVESIIKWKFPMNVVCLFIGNKIKNNISQKTRSELGELKVLCET